MLEFKLQMYFEMYKESVVLSKTRFVGEFTKVHGDFPLVNELFIMIQKYQYKKYGDLIESGRMVNWKHAKHNDFNKNERQRKYDRFGSKQEREYRKWRSKYE